MFDINQPTKLRGEPSPRFLATMNHITTAPQSTKPLPLLCNFTEKRKQKGLGIPKEVSPQNSIMSK